jgi:hypothetical protein
MKVWALALGILALAAGLGYLGDWFQKKSEKWK